MIDKDKANLKGEDDSPSAVACYATVCGMDKKGKFNTFKEAWREMYTWVNDEINAGRMSHQLLETTCWIETDKGPIFFYDARDKAYDEGLMLEGKLVA